MLSESLAALAWCLLGLLGMSQKEPQRQQSALTEAKWVPEKV